MVDRCFGADRFEILSAVRTSSECAESAAHIMAEPSASRGDLSPAALTRTVKEQMQASEQDTTSLLLREYKAGRNDAGLPARTLVLNAEPCGYVFRSGKRLVVYQDGAFYRASCAKRAY